MCYDISTGLFDTNIRRLYMYDKPSQLCQPPHKSRMADCILFHKRKHFLYDFCVGHRPVSLQVGIWIAVLKLNIYICEY